jgi:argininosuccinate lyase
MPLILGLVGLAAVAAAIAVYLFRQNRDLKQSLTEAQKKIKEHEDREKTCVHPVFAELRHGRHGKFARFFVNGKGVVSTDTAGLVVPLEELPPGTDMELRFLAPTGTPIRTDETATEELLMIKEQVYRIPRKPPERKQLKAV